MNKYQEKAWKILSEDERIAITLQLGHHKNTWQAGEIMGKAHYKYIEIQERGKYFFKRYTEHFQIYNSLIHTQCKLSTELKDYFRILLSQRVKPKVALMSVNLPTQPQKRNELIKNQLNWLETSDKTLDRNVLSLIKDYDRWNNFRILPADCQELSAFKRRNKNRNKKDIKNFMEVETFSIKVIMEKYHIIDSLDKTFHVPIFISETEGVSIINIQRDPRIIDKISTAGLYIFGKESEAKEFSEITTAYYLDKINGHNDCKKGLKFWPKFREIVQKAVNYNQIQNLVNSRKHIRYSQNNL